MSATYKQIKYIKSLLEEKNTTIREVLAKKPWANNDHMIAINFERTLQFADYSKPNSWFEDNPVWGMIFIEMKEASHIIDQLVKMPKPVAVKTSFNNWEVDADDFCENPF